MCFHLFLGRSGEASSDGFPVIAIIGIVCGVVLVAVFTFAIIMIVLRRPTPG